MDVFGDLRFGGRNLHAGFLWKKDLLYLFRLDFLNSFAKLRGSLPPFGLHMCFLQPFLRSYVPCRFWHLRK